MTSSITQSKVGNEASSVNVWKATFNELKKYETKPVPYWFKTGRAISFSNTGRFHILRDGWQPYTQYLKLFILKMVIVNIVEASVDLLLGVLRKLVVFVRWAACRGMGKINTMRSLLENDSVCKAHIWSNICESLLGDCVTADPW